MSRILFLNILLLFIINLIDCGGHKPIPTRIKNEFTLRHDGNNPDLAVSIDALRVQDLFQNGLPKYLVPTPYFNTNLDSPKAPFLQGGYMNPFSLYPF